MRVEQDGGIAVFNFTVEGNHNYFILAKEYEYGQTCILVHNDCVLGQNMKDRVRPTAKALKVDWLKTTWSWKKNVEFLREQMKKVVQGTGRIFDIGFKRDGYHGPKSIYRRERELLKDSGFKRIFTGEWITAANGKRFRLYEWILK